MRAMSRRGEKGNGRRVGVAEKERMNAILIITGGRGTVDPATFKNLAKPISV